MGCSSVVHDKLVFERRVARLSALLAQALPPSQTLLDVGCGDGQISGRVGELHPHLTITGIDVQVRTEAAIEVTAYDGSSIPFEAGSFDAVMMVDVLHHTTDPRGVLEEARRVARRWIILKDHCLEGALAGPTLRLMDWFGNARHGVDLPYNYWTKPQWDAGLCELGLTVVTWDARLGLYPLPLRPFFERALHFISVLRVPE